MHTLDGLRDEETGARSGGVGVCSSSSDTGFRAGPERMIENNELY